MEKNISEKELKKGLSIKEQLLLVGLTVVSLVILLGFFVFYSISKINKINSNFEFILSMDDCIEKMTYSENIFLLKEYTQEEFYTDQNTKSVVTFRGYASKFKSLIDNLSDLNISKKVNNTIDSLGILSTDFETTFDSLLVLTQQKGFKDYGLTGEMRTVAHDIENIVSNLNEADLYVHVLQLRRNEKNYFLRKDPRYLDRFRQETLMFFAQLDTSNVDSTSKNDLISKTNSYQTLLEEIANIDNIIGYTGSDGLLDLIESQRESIDTLNESLATSFSEFAKKKVQQIKIQFLVVSILIIIALYIITRRMRKNISVPFLDIKNSLQALSLGIIPGTMTEQKSSSEIREIVRVLNKIIQGFKNSILFTNNLQKGIFDTPYEPLSEKDELGNALIDMKNGLETAQNDQKAQHDEELKQGWINKGTAEFAEVINQNFADIEEFSYSIISKLVKYLDANQGGFYVVNNDNEDDPFLDLTAAFAYDRRKYADCRIELGEGFVGSSVMENNVIYRTEMPEDYISITSGLGGSNPKVLLIVPLVLEDEKYGAMEIASFNRFEDYKIEFIKTISESITTTMSSVKSREKTQKLLDQTQAQSEQIIQAEEEMRQNLEEMQATQEESARREEKLRQDLEEAREEITSLKDQIKKLLENKED